MRPRVPIMLLLLTPGARADATPLTLVDIVRLARERSPAVIEARGRLDAERALSAAAGTRVEPAMLELAAGPRRSDERSAADAEVAWEIPLDGGHRRESRQVSADAATRLAMLELEDARRHAAAEAAARWFEVLHADAAATLARERVALAREFLETAKQRQLAGSAARLDVNLASVEVARSESELELIGSAPARARGALRAALGWGAGEILVSGDLADRTAFDRLASADVVAASAARRSDVEAARARADLAQAEVAGARAASKPPIALRVAALHEEDADALVVGVVIPLASADRMRAETEAAAARRETARALAGLASDASRREADEAMAAYSAASRAARRLRDEAVPLAEVNEELAREAYAAGKFDLTSVLLLRRDAQQVRREHLDRLLDAALAGVELWKALGAPDIGDTP